MIDLQIVETNSRADYVDDCIQRADFVKVNVIDRLIVYVSLCFSKTREDSNCQLLDVV